MFLKFMTADVWDALVIGTILIGLSMAIVRLLKDRQAYKRAQHRSARRRDDQDPAGPRKRRTTR